MIRKLTLAVLGCLVFSLAGAQDRSKEALDKMKAKLSSYGSFLVEFSIGINGVAGDIEGELIVSGEKFHISLDDAEIFFDGKQRYTYNEEDNEAIIENIDPKDNSPLSNPSRFFRFSDSDFAHTYKGRSGNADIVELKPKEMDDLLIILTVDQQSSLPVKIIYEFYDADIYNIYIEKITPNVAVSNAIFTFDAKKHPGVEVNDWR